MITDAQVHLYAPDTPEHPWPKEPGRPTPPARHPRGFSPEEMLAAMDAIGVDRAVIVPPSWSGEDNGPALAAAQRYPERFAVMGRIDPYAPDTRDRLEQWRTHPNLLGIRMSGRWSTTPKQVQAVLDDPDVDWYWSACERLGIPIMLLTGRLPATLAPIAQRHPGLTLIVDHLSLQGGETVAQGFGAIDELVALARYPRVHIKVGGAPNQSRQSFPFTDVHPYLQRVYEAFGAQRLLWEADFTQLTKNTYADCLRLWQEGLPFLSAEDTAWILGRTAATVLNWPEPV